MIKFKVVRYKNLMATGNVFTEIQLDASPTVLITGRNGSGKSTMIEAITFALFNKAYRAVNKPEMINTINNKNCLVEIEFSIGKKEYKIVRGMKPGIFEIWIDGEQRLTVPGTDDQEFLEEVILQMNYKTFTQICIVGNVTYTPFMQLAAAARRDIVEDLLDIKIFSLMNQVLKEKVNVSKQKIKDFENELSVQHSKIDLQQSYIKTLSADRSRKMEENRVKIAESSKLIEETQASIDSVAAKRLVLSESVTDESAFSTKLEKLKPLQFKLRDNINRLSEEVLFFSDNDDCPTCQQAIDAGFKTNAIHARTIKREGISDGMKKLEEQINSATTKLNEISKINREISALDVTIRELQTKINSENRYIVKLNADINAEQSSTVNIDEESAKVKQMAKEAVRISEEKSKESDTKYYLDLGLILLKDTGIKAKVIKQYIPIINKYANKFLNSLDFFASFSLDENFSEKIKSRNRDDLGYNSYSEGEKLKIDLAILFTWITIARMKNTVSTNLFFLDEVTDRGLDNSSSVMIVDILQQFSKDSNVFVISHHPEFFYDKFEKHIKFEKVNNYSTLVD